MSHQPHPWRSRAARAGLVIAIVVSGASAVYATPSVPDMPGTPTAQPPASQPPAAKPNDAQARPAARPKRPRGKVRTVASGAPSSQAVGRADVVAHAMSVRGTPYRWGGSSPVTGFDCSGLSQWAWGKAGVAIARDTYSIWGSEPRVTGDLQAGDLVFFGMGHMGIYVGGNRFIHAPQSGDVVRVTSMAPTTHYGKRYSGAVRPA